MALHRFVIIGHGKVPASIVRIAKAARLHRSGTAIRKPIAVRPATDGIQFVQIELPIFPTALDLIPDLLCLGCTGFKDGAFEVFHRLYDVCLIRVTSGKNTVGFFDMQTRIDYSGRGARDE